VFIPISGFKYDEFSWPDIQLKRIKMADYSLVEFSIFDILSAPNVRVKFVREGD